MEKKRQSKIITKINNWYIKIKCKPYILYSIGIIAFCIFLILYVYLVANKDWLFDLSDKGSIGDAINGITAPIIGIIGVLLIFSNLKAQIAANKLLADQNQVSLILDLTIELKKDIQLIYTTNEAKIVKYVDSIEFGKRFKVSPARHYNYILKSLLNIYSRIKEMDSEKNEILIEGLENLYSTYLKNHCIRISEANIDNSSSEYKKTSSHLCKKIVSLFPTDEEYES